MNDGFLYQNDPIIAQCTPSGSGALAILRVSGKNVRVIVDAVAKLPSKKSILDYESHSIVYGSIIDDAGQLLDCVLFLIMDAPRSFTGEDVIEITCHNNVFVIQSIIELFLRKGCRIAYPGEFTRRAYENKKIDLLQAEAIADLIHAHSQQEVKAALSQLTGSLSSYINAVENELYSIAAWIQAQFEFLDEERDFRLSIRNKIEVLTLKIKDLIDLHDKQKQMRQGIKISLVGSVNAGKSSLFNLLVGQNRAIVTDIAGTTRDTIESSLYRKNFYMTIVDTAGIRLTDDKIEQEGIERSYRAMQESDIILLIYDASRPLLEGESTIYKEILKKYSDKISVIFNKSDLCSNALQIQKSVDIYLSTKTKSGLQELWNLLDEKVAAIFANIATPYNINRRHVDTLLTLESNLQEAIHLLAKSIVHYELLLIKIHDSLELLSQMTGKSVNEKSMDTVFREFCVGK